MKEQKRVPKLRFQEFSGEWKKIQFSKLCNKISDGIHSTPKYNDEGNYYFVNGNNLVDGNILINENTKRLTENEYLKHKRELNENTILISINGTIGNLAFYRNEDIVLGKSACYINIKSKYPKHFFYFSLQTSRIKNYFNSELTGSTIKNLSLKTIKETALILPNVSEQQKTASFLSSVDKKITQLQQKQGLFEDYKKGVLQQIFSQELRFTKEDRTAYPDWEEKKFKEIYSFYSTNSFTRDKLNYESGEVRNVHYGDIHTKFSTLFDIKDELVPYINSEIDLSKIKKDSYLKLGDILIADASEDYKDIGKTIEIVNLNNEKVISGLHTFHARPNKHKMALGFSGYLLQSWIVRKQVMKIAQGTKVLGISTGRLGEIKFFTPSYPEQTQIANFLSTIDKKIAVVETQIEQTQQFKKGLLQQMFV